MTIPEIIGSISGALGIGKWVKKKLDPEPIVRYVHIRYPEESGLQRDLAEKGVKLSWCDERKLQIKLERDGVNNVFVHPDDGKLVILKVKTNPRDLVLISYEET